MEVLAIVLFMMLTIAVVGAALGIVEAAIRWLKWF